jgi:pimeloyl-ACP methyl ester carboxylesterase
MSFRIVTALLALVASGAAQQLDARFDVGGRKLHLVCRGRGSPAVVMEAGMGDGSDSWTPVMKRIAAFSRVCAYDRAGIGTSDPAGTKPRSGAAITSDLHKLLAAAHVRPPYVLVGHSVGGLLVRLYAAAYRREVAGIVLVDSAHEGLGGGGPMTMLVLTPREPLDLAAMMQTARRRRWSANVPLYVLARRRNADELPPDVSRERAAAIQQMNADEQVDLASRSTLGKIEWVQNSGHYIQRDRPTRVVHAVRAVVEAAR